MYVYYGILLYIYIFIYLFSSTDQYTDLTLAAVSLHVFSMSGLELHQELELAAYAQRESFNNVSRLLVA